MACTYVPGRVQARFIYRGAQRALYVESVTPEGTAAHAGLAANDRVVRISDVPVANLFPSCVPREGEDSFHDRCQHEVRERIGGEVGEHLRLRVDHEGTERDVDIVLR